MDYLVFDRHHHLMYGILQTSPSDGG